MTAERFKKVIEEQLDMCKDILVVKAEEYSTQDRLHNFKAAGGMMECDPKEALAGMMAKHTISIYDMCRSGKSYPIELWNEKITDHINYMLLLKALVIEDKMKEQEEYINRLEKSLLPDPIHTNPEDSMKWLDCYIPGVKEEN